MRGTITSLVVLLSCISLSISVISCTKKEEEKKTSEQNPENISPPASEPKGAKKGGRSSWRELEEQIRNVRESMRSKNGSEIKSEILKIKDTLSKIQTGNPEQGGEISKAQASLDETIRLLDSGDTRGARKSFKNAVNVIKSIK